MIRRASPLRRVSAVRLMLVLVAIGLVVASATPAFGPLRGLARVLLVVSVVVIAASYVRELIVRRRRRRRDRR